MNELMYGKVVYFWIFYFLIMLSRDLRCRGDCKYNLVGIEKLGKLIYCKKF